MSQRAQGLASTSLLVATLMGVSQVSTALAYLLIARHSPPGVFGGFVAIVGILTAIQGLVDFGGSGYFVRELASERMRPQVAFRRLAIKTAALVVATFATLFCFALSHRSLSYILAVLLLPTMFAEAATQTVLRGLGKVIPATMVSVLDRGLSLLIVGIGVSTQHASVTTLAIALVCGPTAGFLLGLHKVWTHRPQGLEWDNPFRHTLGYGLGSIATSSQSLDTAILSWVGGGMAAGAYGAVSRWATPLALITGAFLQSAQPRLSRAATGSEAARDLIRSSWVLLPAWVLALATAAASPLVVSSLLGPQYADSAVVLSCLALSVIVSSFSQVLTVLYQARQRDLQTGRRIALGVLTQLVCVATGGSISGATGSAVGTLVAQSGLLIFLVLQGIGMRFPIRRPQESLEFLVIRAAEIRE